MVDEVRHTSFKAMNTLNNHNNRTQVLVEGVPTAVIDEVRHTSFKAMNTLNNPNNRTHLTNLTIGLTGPS